MSDLHLYRAATTARGLIQEGYSWRLAVEDAARTYGVDLVVLAYVVGRWVGGTSRASCHIPVEMRGRRV